MFACLSAILLLRLTNHPLLVFIIVLVCLPSTKNNDDFDHHPCEERLFPATYSIFLKIFLLIKLQPVKMKALPMGDGRLSEPFQLHSVPTSCLTSVHGQPHSLCSVVSMVGDSSCGITNNVCHFHSPQISNNIKREVFKMYISQKKN